MQTYTAPKALVDNPGYKNQRRKCLAGLTADMIDRPIVEIVNGFNELPFCFTLQSCYGHFLHAGQKESQNLDPLPVTDAIARVEYRIAYIAFCLENSAAGRMLYDALSSITAIDLQNIQFCSADWFWKRQVNSYALQVEPDRLKDRDTAVMDYGEALVLERTRNKFFLQMKELLKNLKREIE